MSDFDEEAERERLREQYERDKRKRQATERMSDLLLKGATMTNSHCGECGDPIFRHDGQEFCPTCERVVGQTAEGTADDGAEGTADGGAGRTADGTGGHSADATTSGTDEATIDAGADGVTGDDIADSIEKNVDSTTASADSTAEAADSTVPSTDVTPPGTDASDVDTDRQAESPVETEGVGESDRRSNETSTEQPLRSGPDPSVSGGTPSRTTDLSEARASLTRTVTRLARQAEASDDLGRTREYLEIVREAADALAAVRQADR
ncbi:MAG: Sjogren's syndrome/scleroderma autoantigen 1 family protein [Haloarculaceae archaeon]